jgi:hypothetical protein
MTCSDFLYSALASLLASFVFVFLGVCLYALLFTPQRRRIRAFFGLEGHSELRVYISRIQVLNQGSVGVEGVPLPYQNVAVDSYEMYEAMSLQFLFRDFLRSIFNRFARLGNFHISDVNVSVYPSPIQQDLQTEQGPFIAIGGPAYTGAARFVEAEFRPEVRCEGVAIRVNDRLYGEGDGRWGFIQRIIDQPRDRTIFYVAGLGTFGTVAAAHYLRSNWRQLHSWYGSRTAFYVLVWGPGPDYRNCAVVSQTPVRSQIWRQHLIRIFQWIINRLSN